MCYYVRTDGQNGQLMGTILPLFSVQYNFDVGVLLRIKTTALYVDCQERACMERPTGQPVRYIV
jgi:hypothetical protein